MEYALELSKYINVDIYGPCGKFKCAKSESKKCYGKLNTDYKFYLAFENSNCKDYITEKLYWNGLLWSINEYDGETFNLVSLQYSLE